jgi:ATP-dependent exoDNAse (exonuclease V) beta subunit
MDYLAIITRNCSDPKMSSVPIQDTELRFPDFTIVSASAGAGKTHTLTLRLLQLLLSDRIPKNRLNSILAMTFTRNASAEMRQRVLLYLKKGYLGEKDVLQQLSACLSGNEEDLRTKCGRMIDSILKDYSSFQVQTIDSFMSRVFRSSAFEFGFSPGFEIETDNRHLIEEAFDRFAQNLPEEPAKLQLFENLTDMLAELRQEYARYSWNPYKTLCEMVLELYGNLNAQDRKISPGPAEKIQLRKLEKDIRENIDSLASLASKPGLPVTKYFETLMQAAKKLFIIPPSKHRRTGK